MNGRGIGWRRGEDDEEVVMCGVRRNQGEANFAFSGMCRSTDIMSVDIIEANRAYQKVCLKEDD
jgi:hypothetical protein